MIRSVLAVATVTTIAIGVSVAIAQEDPIKARNPKLAISVYQDPANN
jgi:hypothetical protein